MRPYLNFIVPRRDGHIVFATADVLERVELISFNNFYQRTKKMNCYALITDKTLKVDTNEQLDRLLKNRLCRLSLNRLTENNTYSD